jgi:CPA2 family monovalent cation:H+ antiporter-2
MGLTMLTLAAEEGGTSQVLVAFVVILIASAVMSVVMTRLKQATIPGYLLAGAIVGPGVLGLVSDTGSVEAISHLATILLMFGIGLHMEIEGGKREVIPVTLVGVVSTLLSGIALAVLGRMLGLMWPGAITVGLALSMSSTAVVARILTERREIRQLAGRISFTILLVQDIAAVAILALVPMLARWAQHDAGATGGGGAAGGAIESVTQRADATMVMVGQGSLKVGMVIVFLMFGRYVLPRIMREAARVANGEVMLVVSGAVALGAASVATLAGLSAELGAFVAGLLLASTPFRHQIAGQLEPMRDLFLAIFFAAVGLQVDPAVLVDRWWEIGLGTIGLIALKASVIGGCAWTAGAPPAIAATVGLTLSQAGEFTLIVLGVAATAGVVDQSVVGPVLLTVVLSLVCTPWLMELARQVSPKLAPAPLAPWRSSASMRTERAPTEVAGAEKCRAIIAGFGPVGRAVADRLDLIGIPYTIIELNPETVEKQRARGRSVVYGDATNPEVLEAVRVRGASVVVLAIPDDEATVRACRAIRTRAPGAFIAARVNVLRKGLAAREAGASIVTVDEIAAAEALTRDVIAHIERLTAGGERSDRPVASEWGSH